MAKRFQIDSGRCNLIEIIYSCNTVEELTDLWNQITETEKEALKKFFTDRRKKIQNQ